MSEPIEVWWCEVHGHTPGHINAGSTPCRMVRKLLVDPDNL